MVLQLYIDPLSQPARALMLFVRANKIPVEEHYLSIQKGEHKTEEYKKVNVFQKIPAIVHNDFHLAESIAILRYLARAFPVADHWYPKEDLKAIARIDEFMAWHHIGLRLPITKYMLALLKPERLGQATLPTEADIAVFKTHMEQALDQIENVWLANTKFIAGNEISIADLMAIGEIEMTRLTSYDASQGRPKVAAYIARLKDTLGPQYDEVHETLLKAQEFFKSFLPK